MYWNSLNSLFVKIFLAFWFLILLLTTVLTLLPKLDSRQVQSISSSDHQLLIKQQNKLHQHIQLNNISDIRELLAVKSQNPQARFYITEPSGRLINDKAPRKMRQFIINSSNSTIPLKVINNLFTYIGPIDININKQSYLLYYSYPNKDDEIELIEWLIDNPLLLLISALLISTPLCAFLSWHLTDPLRQLTSVADSVAKGHLDTPFPTIKNSDEITQLASSMQLMVLAIKNMLSNQQRLLSDISHELRSPLTRLGLALAINKKHAGESKELQRIEVETQRLEQMIAEMLNLSRIRLNQYQKEDIAVNEFLGELLLDAEFEASQNGKLFQYTELPTTIINIYPDLAYSAIENIIRNAIKYAKHKISVTIAISSLHITVTIKNDGQLIPEKELTNIFRPFYRLNKSRERETGGAGLGLSIAENAMLKHEGKIWAENIDQQVAMHLQFPRFS